MKMRKDSPIDSKSAGRQNERMVLAMLRKHGQLSQTELCRLAAIGSSTASTIVARLRDKGLVIETRGDSERRGPKPIILTLNPESLYAVGIEINPSYLYIGLFNFVEAMVDKVRVPIGTDHSVEHVITLISTELPELLAKNSLQQDQVLGAGITLSGSVSSNGRVSLSSPLGWKEVPLKDLLAPHFGFRVLVYSNRVRLLAEFAADPALASKNILYLNVANGVGSTVYMNGRLIFGATGRYGEIGHNIIDPAGPVCGCGHKGCLEAHISGPSLSAKVARDLQNDTQTLLSKGLNDSPAPESQLAAWPLAVAEGDAYAAALRDYVAQRLSRCAADAVNSYDPDVLILGGYISQLFAEEFIGAIREEMGRGVYENPARQIDIRIAKAGEDALINGICTAVFQDMLTEV